MSDIDSSTNDVDSSTNEIEELVDAMKQQAAAKNKTSLLAPQIHVDENKTKSKEEFDLEEAVSALIPDKKQNTQQLQVKEKKRSTSNSYNFVFYRKIFYILIILIALIYFIFFYRREDSFVINLPIPYVYFKPYLQSLETFAHLDCHNEVLIITGPRGIGKSRGIQTFVDNNINIEGHSNRLVINFDCERLTEYSTDDDIVDFFKNSILDGFRNLDSYVSSTYRSSPFTNDKYFITEQVSAISKAFRKKNYFYHRRVINRPIRDPFLRSIGKDLSTIISQLKDEPSFCINLLIQCIQILSPSLRPIIIINSPEKLYYLGWHSSTKSINAMHDINTTIPENETSIKGSVFAREIFNTIVKSFKRISHDTIHYGIIIEVSDMVWLSRMSRKYKGDIGIMNVIRTVVVDEFDVNDAKNQLTLRGMFKPQQVHTLYEQFGGYGPHFAQVHELMQQGLQFQDALSSTQRFILNNFLRTMNNLGLLNPPSDLNNNTQVSNFSAFDSNSLMNNQEMKECYDFLNRMIKNYEITFKKKDEVSPNLRRFIVAMIRDGIFSLRNDRHLKFTNLAEMRSAQIFMQKILHYSK